MKPRSRSAATGRVASRTRHGRQDGPQPAAHVGVEEDARVGQAACHAEGSPEALREELHVVIDERCVVAHQRPEESDGRAIRDGDDGQPDHQRACPSRTTRRRRPSSQDERSDVSQRGLPGAVRSSVVPRVSGPRRRASRSAMTRTTSAAMRASNGLTSPRTMTWTSQPVAATMRTLGSAKAPSGASAQRVRG